MTDASGGASSPELVTCGNCGAFVRPGTYCAECGTSLGGVVAKGRAGAYAASPHEHLVHASVITTLFPHLPHRQAHLFRQVFTVGIGVIILLAALRLVAPATLMALLLLPVLYLLYLYESEVYETEPVQVLGLTMVAGGVLGWVYVRIADHLTTPTIAGTQQGPLVTGVLLPVLTLALMLVGPLLLLTRPRFVEILDGLSFGVASALGFTLVAGVTASWSLLTAPLLNGIGTDDLLRVLRGGILAGIVSAGTVGLITSALWLHVHRPPAAAGARPLWRSLPIAIVAALAMQVGLGVAGYYMPTLLGVVILWGAAAAVMLVLVRVILHFGLLEEVAERSTGALVACSECHRLVADTLFCSNCGVSRRAVPKHARSGGPPEAGAGRPPEAEAGRPPEARA